jgi:hypothetical protein
VCSSDLAPAARRAAGCGGRGVLLSSPRGASGRAAGRLFLLAAGEAQQNYRQ